MDNVKMLTMLQRFDQFGFIQFVTIYACLNEINSQYAIYPVRFLH